MREMTEDDVARDVRDVIAAAERGEATLIVRSGDPVALIGPVAEALRRPDLPKPEKPGGLLALVGLFHDWETIEEDMAEIVAERQNDFGRPLPDLFD